MLAVALPAAIFKDRTVTEVIKENAHLTIMLGFILCLTVTLAFTTLRLSELKEIHGAYHSEVIAVPCSCGQPFNTQRLQELLREY